MNRRELIGGVLGLAAASALPVPVEKPKFLPIVRIVGNKKYLLTRLHGRLASYTLVKVNGKWVGKESFGAMWGRAYELYLQWHGRGY
jgi:hypothetical protein